MFWHYFTSCWLRALFHKWSIFGSHICLSYGILEVWQQIPATLRYVSWKESVEWCPCSSLVFPSGIRLWYMRLFTLFKPTETVDMKLLLLVLTSAKWVGGLHALSVHRVLFSIYKVIVHPNAGHRPRVIHAAFRSMPFELLSHFPPLFTSED